MSKKLFAFNVLGELDPRIIEADSLESAERQADKVQQGVPVRVAQTSDMPKSDWEKDNFY
jgi:IMP cyclohydrolase